MGKERLNPSRKKIQGRHRRRKVEKSCVTFLLCDPGWYVHKPDVQNKWDDNTQTTASLEHKEHYNIEEKYICLTSP